jgi:hypothetical protein
MRIKTTSLPMPTLSEGDRIEIGVSHELKINGDGSWVSYKVTTKVGDGETAEAAHQRALEFLSRQVEELVKRTVADVLRMSQ